MLSSVHYRVHYSTSAEYYKHLLRVFLHIDQSLTLNNEAGSATTVIVAELCADSGALCFEGLHDEEGTQEEELDRALVRPPTHLAVVLHL